MANSKNRLILFCVAILVVACVAAPTYFAVRNYYYKLRFYEILFDAMEKDESLISKLAIGSKHSSSQIVGQFKDKDAESNFNFVNAVLQLQIPDGTVMDQCDGGFGAVGSIYCCFTFPSAEAFPVLPDPTFSVREKNGTEPLDFSMLTAQNRDVPDNVTVYDITVPNNPWGKVALSHSESNRLWLIYCYHSPTD